MTESECTATLTTVESSMEAIAPKTVTNATRLTSGVSPFAGLL
ncbi:hypothetical protein [Nocardia tengchongensis]